MIRQKNIFASILSFSIVATVEQMTGRYFIVEIIQIEKLKLFWSLLSLSRFENNSNQFEIWFFSFSLH